MACRLEATISSTESINLMETAMNKYWKRMAAPLAAALTLTASAAQAQTTLRYSNWLPLGHPLRAQVMEPWAEEVAKATQGRVKVEVSPKVIGTVAGQFDAIVDGLADVALFVPSYSAGRFELTELMELPFLADSAAVRSPVTYKFFAQNLAKFDEYKGVTVLSLFPGPAQHVSTAKRPIKTIEDFQGLKLRSPSPIASQTVTLLGGIPVLKPATEIYEMVSGGLLDGAVFTIPDALSFKLTNLLPRVSIVPGGLGATVIVLGVNPAKWKTIGEADQQAIMKVSGEKLAQAVGTAYDIAEKESLEATRKSGGTVETLSPALVAAMKQRVLPIEQGAIEKARKKGVADPAALIAILRSDLAKATK